MNHSDNTNERHKACNLLTLLDYWHYGSWQMTRKLLVASRLKMHSCNMNGLAS